MARSDSQLAQNLQRLDELSGYEVEDGDLDPRGWTVVSTDGGTLGTVEHLIVDTTTMKVRYFEVEPDAAGASGGDDYFLVDAQAARVDESGRQVIADAGSYSSAYASGQSAGSSADADVSRTTAETAAYAASDLDKDSARLTRSEEELRIGKREVARGEARVAKRVETEHVQQPVTVRREEIVIERRPVTGEGAQATIKEGEIRVPLMEEEVVAEKRAVVKEELVIGKRIVEETKTIEADLRKERFEVENDASVAADRDSTRTTTSRDKQ